ncbi:hypothetical protein [Nonomuraea wenchangensis]|uniref:hypothetical protein n=1 Tax=Nonomuraea wenchangensis TaxID=568860 RepID=UPI003332ED17
MARYELGDLVEIVRHGVIVEVDPKDPARHGLGREGRYGADAYFRTDDPHVEHRLTGGPRHTHPSVSDHLVDAIGPALEVASVELSDADRQAVAEAILQHLRRQDVILAHAPYLHGLEHSAEHAAADRAGEASQ